MTEADVAITARGVGKTYRVARVHERPVTAAEAALKRIRHPTSRTPFDTFHALDDLNFTIPWGEAVGVIGRNGAGKSTLLKILTRITAPSSGRIELGGRIGSLLEVGTGFHPELTGRENVYLNGTLLGMRHKEIARRFDEIVEFSGVARFLDTQVKRYSSGMYVRLAFAVAAHLETEILAVDEVLAVGDADFQAKCLTKLRQVASDGRTVLLVSHQIQTVHELCSSALYLQDGRLVFHGSVDEAAGLYRASYDRGTAASSDPSRRPGTGALRFAEVIPLTDSFESAEEKQIRFHVPALPEFGRYYVSAHIVDAQGTLIAQCDSRVLGQWFDAATEVDCIFALRNLWLKPGPYTVDLFLCQSGIVDAWEGSCSFEVIPSFPYPQATSADGLSRGTIFADFSYDTR